MAWLALGIGACSLLMLVLAHPRAKAVLAWAVGATGGLVAVQVHGVNLFTIVTTVWFVYSGRRGSARPAGVAVVFAALLVSSTALTGDLVGHPVLALQLLGLAVNAAMIVWRASATDARWMGLGLLAACTVGGIAAILEVGRLLPGAVSAYGDVSALGRPVGIYPEPDWLGMFGGIGLVLAWRTLRLSPWRHAVVLLNAAGLILAFARAAWLGVLVAGTLYVAVATVAGWRREGQRSVRRTVGAATLLAVIAGAGLALVPTLRSDLGDRISSITRPHSGDISGQARVRQIKGLEQLAETAPWYGHGLSTSGRISVWGEYDPTSTNYVGSNWVLSLWVDAKYLALPLITLLLYAALRRPRALPAGLMTLLLVNNLFSNATFFPVTWLVLGLSLSSVRNWWLPPEETTASVPTLTLMSGSPASSITSATNIQGTPSTDRDEASIAGSLTR